MKIRWTETAFKDLKKIFHHIEQDRSSDIAASICRAIYGAAQALRRSPHIGRPALNDTRELVVDKLPYIISYRVIGSEAVQILRIWHGAQYRH